MFGMAPSEALVLDGVMCRKHFYVLVVNYHCQPGGS